MKFSICAMCRDVFILFAAVMPVAFTAPVSADEKTGKAEKPAVAETDKADTEHKSNTESKESNKKDEKPEGEKDPAKLLVEKEKQLEILQRSSKKLQTDNVTLKAEVDTLKVTVETLTTDIEAANKEKKLAEIKAAEQSKSIEDLTKNLKALEQQLRQLKDETHAKLTAADKRYAELDAKRKSLEDRLDKVSPSGYVRTDPKPFNAPANKKRITIQFADGKQQQAELLCQTLGFKYSANDINPKFKEIRATFDGEMTEETLQILSAASRPNSIIKAAEPVAAAGELNSVSVTLPRPSPSQCQVLSRRAETFDEFLSARWALEATNVKQAWLVVVNSQLKAQPKPLTIAVIDSGFDWVHEDLNLVLWRGKTGEHGKNFADEESLLPDQKWEMDERIHGTHVASQVAYVSNVRDEKRERVEEFRLDPEFRPQAELMLLKVNPKEPRQIADAIEWAVANGAAIINLSISHRSNTSGSKADAIIVSRVVDAVVNPSYNEGRGVLIVCAAGNVTKDSQETGNNDIEPEWPSCLGSDKLGEVRDGFPDPIDPARDSIISVAAVELDANRKLKLAEYSNFGSRTVDIAAPGGNEKYITAQPGPDFTYLDYRFGLIGAVPVSEYEDESSECPGAIRVPLKGTSHAAPLVAGAAALLWNLPENQRKSAVQIKQLLLNSVRKVDGLKDRCVSGGILDLGTVSFRSKHLHDASHRRDLGLPEEFWKGYSAYKRGDSELAVSLLEQAERKAPDFPEVHYILALANADRGALTDADRHIRMALRLELTYPLGEKWARLMEPVQGNRRALLEKARRTLFAFNEFDPSVTKRNREGEHYPIWGSNATSLPPTGNSLESSPLRRPTPLYPDQLPKQQGSSVTN